MTTTKAKQRRRKARKLRSRGRAPDGDRVEGHWIRGAGDSGPEPQIFATMQGVARAYTPPDGEGNEDPA